MFFKCSERSKTRQTKEVLILGTPDFEQSLKSRTQLVRIWDTKINSYKFEQILSVYNPYSNSAFPVLKISLFSTNIQEHSKSQASNYKDSN